MRPDPPLVQRALALARDAGFTRSCLREVGLLLHVLAGERGRGRVAEIGTGYGVGAAWIAAALPPGVPLFTAEFDAERARVAAELFAEDQDVHVLAGDWRERLPGEAPLDLLFVDARAAKHEGEAVLGLVAPRGTIVLDDLTPGYEGPDPVRDFWLGHGDLAATEVLVTPQSAAIVAVRVR